MDSQVSDEVIVFIDNFEFLRGVVVVNSDLRVVCTNHDPLLASHELGASHWSISHFKRAHLCLLIVIKNCNVACVESDQDPG